jgi:hypothetical protein
MRGRLSSFQQGVRKARDASKVGAGAAQDSAGDDKTQTTQTTTESNTEQGG